MKVNTMQYSKLLYELTAGKSRQDINNIIVKFTEQLIKNRQLKLSDKIIEKFSEIYNKENGIVEAEIVSREKLSTGVRTLVRTYVSNKYKAKKVVLVPNIDKSIKGGIIVKVGDEILDASINKQLINLNKLLKT